MSIVNHLGIDYFLPKNLRRDPIIVILNRTIDSLRIKKNEFPLIELIDATTKSLNDWTIPAVCYQTWVDNKFGKTHYKEIANFRALNSDLAWVLFDDEKMNSYMQRAWSGNEIFEVYARSKFGPMRADIFRYCLLYDQGGYYFDIGKGCNKSIRSFHDRSSSGLISFENNICITPPTLPNHNLLSHPTSLIIQWGFGFAPRHPFLKEAIRLIEINWHHFKEKSFPNPKEAILSLTGPGLFTQAVRNSMTKELSDSLTQSGVDFQGFGISSLPGSYVRYFSREHYTESQNSSLFV